MKRQVTERGPRPVHSSYHTAHWSRPHLKTNARNRNQWLIYLLSISYRGVEESLNLPSIGLLTAYRNHLSEGRGAADLSHHPVSGDPVQLRSPAPSCRLGIQRDRTPRAASFCQGRCTGTWQIQQQLLQGLRAGRTPEEPALA